MKIFYILTACLFLSCGGMIDRDWGLRFRNDAHSDMYFYLDYDQKGHVTYPAYDGLTHKPYLHLIRSQDEGGWSMWPTKFQYGMTGHVYAFSPDTLERYAWNEIVSGKKYWFGEIVCGKEPIRFPEEFAYMGIQ